VGKTKPLGFKLADKQKHPHGRGEDRRYAVVFMNVKETPPRAWGRRSDNEADNKMLRNTPTGVGKTGVVPELDEYLQKHPHGRGEDSASSVKLSSTWETPPRAWGRPPQC